MISCDSVPLNTVAKRKLTRSSSLAIAHHRSAARASNLDFLIVKLNKAV